ncbi:MucR family transcriptional regulator [Brucella pituitosa]|uniref:MucR family transcriptional regulator n=1 Tax=Brucella pituitosa TaxID=571256 RepID=UPI003F4AD5B8
MLEETTLPNLDYTRFQLTAQIVAAWAANNSARTEDLLETIHTVHKALSELQASGLDMKAEGVAIEAPKPAVAINKSVKDKTITCLFCGKAFRSIRRHLGTAHQMTPDEYRNHFSLPHGYPMVALGYSKERSDIALKLGLGRKSS